MARATSHIAIAGLLAFCTPALAQQSGEMALGARIEALEAAIPTLMDSGSVTGLSIAWVADGEVAWARGFGVRNADTDEPVDESTVFEAASLTKPVVAYAVLQMIDRGELDLDRPLAEYMPYEDIAYDDRYTRITARMVLSHTPGFPNWRPRGGKLELRFDPGERFSYSGEGFVYLQRVVEKLSGQTLDVFVRDWVLKPLAMTRSSLVWEERFADNVAVGHFHFGGAMEKNEPESPNAAWSLQSTATDYARFIAALMAGRELSVESAHEMMESQVEVAEGLSWGLGVGLQDSSEGRAFWHWGHNDGYRGYTIAFPDQGTAVVWFTNSDNGMLILEPLLDATVGGEHPAVAWLDYERYDDPQRLVRVDLEKTIMTRGIEAGLARYHQLKNHYPAEAFEEGMLNTLGYQLLRGNRFEEAIEIFKLNVEAYPDAFNTYDSLGDAYAEAGEVELAIENYARAVELNPEHKAGEEKIRKLREEAKND